jgi:hypothetical protein
MSVLPPELQPLIAPLSIGFSHPTFQRFVLLLIGAILTPGRHTITNLLWTVRPMIDGDPSSYHRLLSCRVWPLWPLGRVLAALVLAWAPAHQPVIVALDDTAAQHKGKHVYGKGRHRDAVRSSHSHTVWLWGHKWVVAAVCVRLPGVGRPWALPVLCALYRTPQLSAAEGRRHKTPLELARALMATLLHWFPDRRFVFLGDGGYGTHELARFCARHGARAVLISRLHPKARLYAPPPRRKKGQPGRPRAKGEALPKPQDAAAGGATRGASVSWYGGQRRKVGLLDGRGHWYRIGRGLVAIRWVYVEDRQGTHRPEYFFCTDPALAPREIVSLYTARWAIEVTFQEARAHLGVHTTRCRKQESVLRATPCLLGLFSLVSLAWANQGTGTAAVREVPGYAKGAPTFTDALASVRRSLWQRIFLRGAASHPAASKPTSATLDMLLECVSYAA